MPLTRTGWLISSVAPWPGASILIYGLDSRRLAQAHLHTVLGDDATVQRRWRIGPDPARGARLSLDSQLCRPGAFAAGTHVGPLQRRWLPGQHVALGILHLHDHIALGQARAAAADANGLSGIQQRPLGRFVNADVRLYGFGTAQAHLDYIFSNDAAVQR